MNGLVIRSFSSVKVKVLLRELHIDHHPRFFLWAQGGKYSDLYKAKMNVLRYLRIDLCPRRRTHDLALKHAAPRPTGTLARLAKSRRTYLPTAHTRNDVRFRSCVLGSNLFASPAVGKFSRASSAGDRHHLQTNFANWIVSVAEDCLSPERTFHG